MAPNKGISAGNQLSFWGQVDSIGFFNGTSGAVATGATGEPMGKLLGIKTASPGPVEPDFVNITGDDTVLGAIDFGPNQAPTWIVEVAAFDMATDAILQGTLVETLGGLRIGVLQPNDPSYPDTCLIYQAKTKYKDTGSDGVKAWSGFIVPLATMIPLGRKELNERTPAVYRYKVVAQTASRKPWGVTISEALLGTSGGPLLPFTSDYPIVMERFTGNAIAVTFNLTYTPVSVARTVVHVDTAPTTVLSVSTTSKTFTLSSAPAAGAKVEVIYEFTP